MSLLIIWIVPENDTRLKNNYLRCWIDSRYITGYFWHFLIIYNKRIAISMNEPHFSLLIVSSIEVSWTSWLYITESYCLIGIVTTLTERAGSGWSLSSKLVIPPTIYISSNPLFVIILRKVLVNWRFLSFRKSLLRYVSRRKMFF